MPNKKSRATSFSTFTRLLFFIRSWLKNSKISQALSWKYASTHSGNQASIIVSSSSTSSKSTFNLGPRTPYPINTRNRLSWTLDRATWRADQMECILRCCDYACRNWVFHLSTQINDIYPTQFRAATVSSCSPAFVKFVPSIRAPRLIITNEIKAVVSCFADH